MPYQAMTDSSRSSEARTNGAPSRSSSNGKETASVGQVTSHASGLAHDLITLVELQTRLLYYDVREAGRQSAFSGVLLVAMIALILSSIPVVLLGTAECLVQWAGWGRAASFLTVGGVTAVLGAVIAWLSFR